MQGRLQNLARETARGIDLDARYRHDALGGTFAHRALLTYVAERKLVAYPGADPFAGAGEYDQDNFGAIPEWKGSYRLQWSSGDLQLGYDMQWIGSLVETGGRSIRAP